jgi:hypothetical protein
MRAHVTEHRGTSALMAQGLNASADLLDRAALHWLAGEGMHRHD